VPPPDLDLLDDHRLAELYDAGSRARGRAYADEGRIELLQSDGNTIKAACRGSGGAAYVLTIRWEVRGGGVGLDDTCSCPLGGGCKHCVAAILTARRRAAAARATPTGAAVRADWRRLLGDLDAPTDTPVGGLALQVAVRRPGRGRYGDGGTPRLTLRPMREGASGKWIKSGASWRDVASSYGYQLADADPLQRAALQAVLSATRTSYYAGEEAIPLDDFGPGLWHQLRQATEVGVALIGHGELSGCELWPRPAEVAIDLTADATGAVTIATTVTVDGEPVALDGDGAGLLGHPGHGLWRIDGATVHLVPFAKPLHPAVSRLVGAGAITIPAADVDELLDAYQPALARHATVTSSDGSVALTSNELERIVLVIERQALDVAALTWTARYRRGDRVTDHPLLSRGGRHRDRVAEQLATADLRLPTHLLPAIADPLGDPRDAVVQGPDVVVLLTEVVPWLQTIGGIHVEVRGDQPALREADEDPLVSLSVTDALGADTGPGGQQARAEGNDWFDLHVAVSVDGEAVDFASLFAALHRGDPALILPSGIVLRLDRPEFERLRQLIDEARSLVEPDGDGVARINRFQAGWWEELVDLGVVAQQSDRWARSIGQMAALAAPEPVPVPPGFSATLRPYQQDGLDWLAFLHRHRLGGILADDMGLGKTIQVLAFALHVLQTEPSARFLVVAPTSVVENWAHEAARFAPSIAVHTMAETNAKRGTSLAHEIGDASLVVTSYALFRLDFDAYAELGWDVLILDEAQFVKNHRSKIYRCARRLDVPTKVAVTGTPLENSLMDLWSLLSIAAPGLYPDPARFGDTYRKPIERGDAPELLATLRRRIAPLVRRRTKDEVLRDLPPKIEQVVEVPLSPRHARIYATQLQRQRQKVLGLVGDVQKHRFEILRSLTILRQLALDPGLVDEEHEAVGSAKLDRLLEDLEQIVAEGHRALVFSQFTRFLALVRTRLDDAGIDHAYLDGRTRNRDAAIQRFKQGDAPVFVVSLKAGGFGLNLTEADYCFILDPWWNPATETQAVDRTHRIGQTNPVVVYRYVSVDTIEEKVMELKARKADLFTAVVDADGALAGPLSEDDIRGLLDLGP
jgi:superfamily II DNA or RNA helicase